MFKTTRFLCGMTSSSRPSNTTWVRDEYREDWAIVYADATKFLLDAILLLEPGAERTIAIGTAARWYAVLPQLIFRESGRGGKDERHSHHPRALARLKKGNWERTIGIWRKAYDKK